MYQYRRRSSLGEIPESSFEMRRPSCLERSSRQYLASEDPKNDKSLRRCRSNPEKKRHHATSALEWQSVLDKERGYITDLIAENKPSPITDQPQLSYFAYLGSSDPKKGGYQSVSFSDATETIINLGGAIYFQNQINKPRSLARPLLEETEQQWYTLREPTKTDKTRFVECCTCMCCVKALFYHCTKDHELEGNWVGQPCACEEPGVECVARWGILGVLSLLMPCLLCYPFLNGCCKTCIYLKREQWKP